MKLAALQLHLKSTHKPPMVTSVLRLLRSEGKNRVEAKYISEPLKWEYSMALIRKNISMKVKLLQHRFKDV